MDETSQAITIVPLVCNQKQGVATYTIGIHVHLYRRLALSSKGSLRNLWSSQGTILKE